MRLGLGSSSEGVIPTGDSRGVESSEGIKQFSPDKSVSLKPEDIAVLCARLADQKKAEDITILRLHDFIVDYFVVASGRNKKQLQAISDEMEITLKRMGVRKLGIEGYPEGLWILLDYGEVVVHLFLEEVRQYYDLEFLWSDTERVGW